jgi:hypothetical protein
MKRMRALVAAACGLGLVAVPGPVPLARGGRGRAGDCSGSRRRNAVTLAELTRASGYEPIFERTLRDPRLARTGSRSRPSWATGSTTSGRTRRTRAACGGARRGSRTWRRAAVGDGARHRCARRAENVPWAFGGATCLAPEYRALPRPAVARRCGRGGGPRVRHAARVLRRGRLPSARGEAERGLGRRGRAAGRHRLRRGQHDDVGLRAHGEAVAAGHAAGRADSCSRRRSKPTWASGVGTWRRRTAR